MPQENSAHRVSSQMIPLINEEGNKTSTMEKLEDIYRQGSYGPFNLFADKKHVPLGLSSKGVWDLVHGKKKKSIRKEHLDYLINTFLDTNASEHSDHRASNQEIELIDVEGKPTDYLKEIRNHRDRTAVGAIALLKDQEEIPNGLTSSKIDGWLKGKTKKARRDHVIYVLNLWGSLSDADARTTITPEIKEKLLNLIEVSNVPIKILLKEMKDRAPTGITSAAVSNWVTGKSKSAVSHHLDFFINELQNIINLRKNFIAISDDIRNQLLFEKKRTGVSPKALLREQNDLPEGMIKRWVGGWISGSIDKAEEDHLNYVFRKWRELPEVKQYYRQSSKLRSHEKMPRVKRPAPIMEEITEEIRGLLQSKLSGGTITGKYFLRRFAPIPDGLTGNMLSRWVSGYAKKARKSHLTFVFEHLEKLPSAAPEEDKKFESIKKYSPYINREIIKEEDILEIKMQQVRTGVGAVQLLKNAKNVPEGLVPSMVTTWTNRYVRTAYPEHIKYVLKKWRELPDIKDGNPI